MESNLVWTHSICHKFQTKIAGHEVELSPYYSQFEIAEFNQYQQWLAVAPDKVARYHAKTYFLKLKSGVNKGVRVGGHLMKTVHLICGWVINLSQFGNSWWIKCRNPRENMAWRSMLRRLRWWKPVRGLVLRNSRSFLRVTIKSRIAP